MVKLMIIVNNRKLFFNILIVMCFYWLSIKRIKQIELWGLSDPKAVQAAQASNDAG